MIRILVLGLLAVLSWAPGAWGQALGIGSSCFNCNSAKISDTTTATLSIGIGIPGTPIGVSVTISEPKKLTVRCKDCGAGCNTNNGKSVKKFAQAFVSGTIPVPPDFRPAFNDALSALSFSEELWPESGDGTKTFQPGEPLGGFDVVYSVQSGQIFTVNPINVSFGPFSGSASFEEEVLILGSCHCVTSKSSELIDPCAGNVAPTIRAPTSTIFINQGQETNLAVTISDNNDVSIQNGQRVPVSGNINPGALTISGSGEELSRVLGNCTTRTTTLNGETIDQDFCGTLIANIKINPPGPPTFKDVVNIGVDDTCGATSRVSIPVVLNRLPTIEFVGEPQRNPFGRRVTLTYTVNIFDPDVAVGEEAGLSVSAFSDVGQVSVIASEQHVYEVTVTIDALSEGRTQGILSVTARDRGGSVRAQTLIDLTQFNVPPKVSLNGGKPVINPGQSTTFTLRVNDPDNATARCALSHGTRSLVGITAGLGTRSVTVRVGQSLPLFFQSSPFDSGGYSDTLSATCTDSRGGTGSASASIKVNALPHAKDITVETSQGQSVPIVFSGNDADGEIWHYLHSDPLKGQADFGEFNGVGLYMPIAADGSEVLGTDRFTYTVIDNDGGQSQPAQVTILIHEVQANRAPSVAIEGNTRLVQGAPNPFELVVQDPDGDVVDCTLSAGQGQAVLTSGFGQLLNDGLHMLMTPAFQSAPFFYQADTFDGLGFEDTITANCQDNKGLGTSAFIDVHLNSIPQAQPQSATLDEDSPQHITLNASDPDGDALSASLSAPPAHGLVKCSGLSCTYTPDLNYFGADGFGYTVRDDFGGLAQAQVSLTVLPVNDPPTTGNDDASTDEDNGLTLNVLANDSDVDGNLDLGTFTLISGASHGTVTGAGTVQYTPDVNFNGSDAFTYQICDDGTPLPAQCANQTVSITVNPVNDPPTVLVPSVTSIANEDSANVSLNIAAYFADVDIATNGDVLGFDVVGNSNPGLVSASGSGNTLILSFAPDQNGTATLTVRASDQAGAFVENTINVTVNPVNDPPVLTGALSNVIVDEDAPSDTVSLSGLFNDVDIATNTDSLTLSVSNSNPGLLNASAVGSTLTLSYNANQNGTSTVTVRATDQTGAFVETSFALTVNPVNDPPVINDDPGNTTDPNTPVTIAVTSNDTDVDGDPVTVQSFSQGSNGSVSCGATSCTYTPNNGFSGADAFTYTATDGNGATGSATVSVTVVNPNSPPTALTTTIVLFKGQSQTVTVGSDPDADFLNVDITNFPSKGVASPISGTTPQISYTHTGASSGTDMVNFTLSDGQASASGTVFVSIVNRLPIANSDSTSTPVCFSITINVLSNDFDPDVGDTLSLLSASNGALGNTTKNGNQITYTPTGVGVGFDTFTYTISDGDGGTAVGSVSVNVLLQCWTDDFYNTNEDVPLTVDAASGVLANDHTDIFVNPPTIAAFDVVTTQGGSVDMATDGAFTYIPPVNFFGDDTFTYTVCDGPQCATATVTVTVNSVNDPPLAADDTYSTALDAPLNVDAGNGVLSNDVDPDGDVLTVGGFDPASAQGGTVAVNPDGSFAYTPPAGFTGEDTFTYISDDGFGGQTTATVTITVM